MKFRTTTLSVAVLIAFVTVAPASAQYEEKAFISANAGLQLPLDSPFTHDASYPYRQETARISASYTIPSAIVYDVAGGGMVTYRFGIQVAYSMFKGDHAAGLRATIPHPTVFNTPATATFTTPTELMHRETALHANLVFAPVVGEALNVKIFGGPSYFQIKQDLIEHFDVTENVNFITLAYDLAITSTQQKRAEATGFGFNAGVDTSFYFSEHVGVGALVRYVHASIPITNVLGAAVGSTQKSSASGGGLTGGGGLRFRF